MLSRTCSGIVLGVLVINTVHANTVRYYSGTECEAYAEWESTLIRRSNEGCENNNQDSDWDFDDPVCGAEILVVLPISRNNNDSVNYDNVQLNYLDGNIAESVICFVAARNSSGTTYVSTTQYSGEISTGNHTFTWTGSSLPNSGNTITGTQVQHVACFIPAPFLFFDGTCVNEFFGASYVRNYRIDGVNP